MNIRECLASVAYNMEYCGTLQATAYITRRQCDEGIEHATLMCMHLLCLYAMNLSQSTTIRYLFGLRTIKYVCTAFRGLGVFKIENSSFLFTARHPFRLG